MYAFIRGTLIESNAQFAVLEAGGVGYQLHIPSNLSCQLPDIGTTVLLHTTFIVREGFQGLYGFYSAEEKELFNELIEISGIGPKIALGLIGHISIPQLQDIILREDAAALSKLPGIGKKTAERLLIELRNRLEKFFSTTRPRPSPSPSQTFQDALKALLHLGYNRNAAQNALRKTLEHSENLPLSDLISTSLKHF